MDSYRNDFDMTSRSSKIWQRERLQLAIIMMQKIWESRFLGAEHFSSIKSADC
jgi:hypothetical protein